MILLMNDPDKVLNAGKMWVTFLEGCQGKLVVIHVSQY